MLILNTLVCYSFSVLVYRHGIVSTTLTLSLTCFLFFSGCHFLFSLQSRNHHVISSLTKVSLRCRFALSLRECVRACRFCALSDPSPAKWSAKESGQLHHKRWKSAKWKKGGDIFDVDFVEETNEKVAVVGRRRKTRQIIEERGEEDEEKDKKEAVLYMVARENFRRRISILPLALGLLFRPEG